MRIRVLFFGLLKDLAGRANDCLDLPEGATVDELLKHYSVSIPHFKDLLPSVALSVNRQYAGPNVKLKADDEVALLPPVSGGTPRVLLVREKIDTQGALESIKRPEDGAAVVFEGVVRNNTRGRPTLYLEYESYEDMALKELGTLVEQALAQFKVRDVTIIHRLGRLEIGETSVLIVVAAAHRGVAFDACRWLIDALKRTVPIWKKEYFEDGAVWADGEPFPADIRAGTHSQRPASK
ncbi:MAG: molybdopterin synthase [Acidobacteria bacterium]|nr:MAG: molybdopterin synthase [Acidobacteriota bacterium]PYY08373.1 MAG: molybdopterin synthase [Acidobacteriota bacterium]